jgi:alpha-beta hydrolase superfamily lysophospholipase
MRYTYINMNIKKWPSYMDRPEWHRYQRFLPERLRYSSDTIPAEEWVTWKDANVHVDRLANESARAKVLLLHGGGGNGRVLLPLAAMLFRMGYEVIAPDFPGYGLTRYGNQTRPHYETWSQIGSDLVDRELERDSRPVVVFGLSIGGMLAYMVAARNPRVAGLIGTTFADVRDIKVRDAVSKNLFLSRVGGAFAQAFWFITDHLALPIKMVTKMDLITNDPEFSALFKRDPLAGGGAMSFRFMRSLLQMRPAVEPEGFSSCPVLLAHPGLDPWTPLSISRPFYDRIAAPKELVVLAGAGHFPYEEPGLTQLHDAVARFLAGVVQARSKRA